MPMTRRSARFRQIAERTDVTCAQFGVQVEPADVETALWQRIEHVDLLCVG
jgi:hypothetical protein